MGFITHSKLGENITLVTNDKGLNKGIRNIFIIPVASTFIWMCFHQTMMWEWPCKHLLWTGLSSLRGRGIATCCPFPTPIPSLNLCSNCEPVILKKVGMGIRNTLLPSSSILCRWQEHVWALVLMLWMYGLQKASLSHHVFGGSRQARHQI